MSQDIDLQKVRRICETDAPPGTFYEQLRKNNVSLCDSPLPILEPVLRTLYISAFNTLTDDEMRYLLRDIARGIDLGSIPIIIAPQVNMNGVSVHFWPRAYAFAAVKLGKNPDACIILGMVYPSDDFSSISSEALPEVKALTKFVNKSMTLAVDGQPVDFTATSRCSEMDLTRQLDAAEAKVQRLQHRLQQQDGIIRKLSNAIIDQSTIHSQLKTLDVELLQSRNTIKRLNGVYASLSDTQQKRICTDVHGADTR